MVSSFCQFKCMKYFRDNLTFVLSRIPDFQIIFFLTSELPAPTAQCKKMDIVLVVDRSGSIRKDDYEHMRDFLKRLGESLKIGERDENGEIIGQGAIVTFSERGRLQISLKRSQTPGEFSRVVRTMPGPLEGGRTKTHRGLKIADKEVVSRAGGMRLDDPNVVKIFMVMTDGKQTVESRRRGLYKLYVRKVL